MGVLVALQGVLGDDGFEHFQSLDSFRKASFILGSELWEDKFGSLLSLVKGFILDVWELRKHTTDPVSDCVWGAAGCRWWKG